MRAWLPAGLAVTALGLGGAVFYQAVAPVTPVAELPVALAPVAPVTLTAFVPPAEDQFAITNDRTLFDPARQPVAEPAQAGAPGDAPPALTLIGVAVGGGNAIALLKRAEGGPAISAHIGQAIDGWQLVRIESGLVVLRGGGREFTVKMRAAAGLPQPPLRRAAAPDAAGRPDGKPDN
ncbi:MAG: hypothetical protein WDM91_22230 [Rhizomicrobium sp.]